MSASISNMQAALDEAGKVVKKQKTCAGKTDALLEQLIAAVKQGQQELMADTCMDPDVVMSDLHKKVESLDIAKELNSQTKDLHSAIGKLGKALDRTFNNEVDLCQTLRPITLDKEALNQILAEHFYREGRFDLGDQFSAEAGIPTDTAQGLKAPYISMHNILKEIKGRNLSAALAWAQDNRAKLSRDGGPSAFEFKLHSLNFLNTLHASGPSAAIRYAKQHFAPFQGQHMPEIQRLMASILFANKPPGQNPYADLASALSWDETAQEFARQACGVLGQAYQSPLTVAVAAGSIALPALLKLAALFEKNLLGTNLHTCEQLPVEIELGPEFVFHSIFACPVSRDQSTADNPPVLLPCNHVLCEQSVLKIAKSRNRMFKCPYCPMEARADLVSKLTFPDVP